MFIGSCTPKKLCNSLCKMFSCTGWFETPSIYLFACKQRILHCFQDMFPHKNITVSINYSIHIHKTSIIFSFQEIFKRTQKQYKPSPAPMSSPPLPFNVDKFTTKTRTDSIKSTNTKDRKASSTSKFNHPPVLTQWAHLTLLSDWKWHAEMLPNAYETIWCVFVCLHLFIAW